MKLLSWLLVASIVLLGRRLLTTTTEGMGLIAVLLARFLFLRILLSTILVLRSSCVLSRLLRSHSLSTIVLRTWLYDWLLFLWFDDRDGVWKGFLWTGLAFWI